MDFAFFGAYQVLILIEFREIKAHAPRQAVQKCLFIHLQLLLLIHH